MHRHALLAAALILGLSTTCVNAQVTRDAFLVRSTGDLITLCASQTSDPLYTAAQNFCQGFAVGVYQTLEALQTTQRTKLFCPPAQMPSRNEAVANFVRWAQASPSRLQTAPTDGIAAYLAERLPCQSAAR